MILKIVVYMAIRISIETMEATGIFEELCGWSMVMCRGF